MKSSVVFSLLLWTTPAWAQQTTQDSFAQPPYWLKAYSQSPVKEHWTLTLQVKNLEKDLPKVLDRFQKEGATLTHSLDTFASSKKEKSQQLSYRLSLASAKEIMKKLRKLGTTEDPVVRVEPGQAPPAEISEKIGKLMAVKKDRAALLAKMPEVSSLVDEVLEKFLLVEHNSKDSGTAVLLNVTVRQRPAK